MDIYTFPIIRSVKNFAINLRIIKHLKDMDLKAKIALNSAKLIVIKYFNLFLSFMDSFLDKVESKGDLLISIYSKNSLKLSSFYNVKYIKDIFSKIKVMQVLLINFTNKIKAKVF